jgi:outer membrane cobalamin receptor
MKNSTRIIFSLWIVLLSGLTAFGQNISGKILDEETGEPLIGATVLLKGTSLGAATGIDGTFTFEGKTGDQVLIISYVGYITKELDIKITSGKNNLGNIQLKSNAIGLQEIKVVSNYARDRQTPVSISTLKPEQIEEQIGTKEFPELLNTTPSVYATKGGGGFGDGRINLRGFDSDNIGVLINGVPVNDMENGHVYWSNWAGLADVTRIMQVQRGLGASKLAISSVGGTINIITNSTDAKKGGSVYVATGNNAYSKRGFTVSTGLLDNNWAITLSGSKTTGDGYVTATNFEAYSYFLNISKKINDNHFISLTAFGAPQWHNQRGSYHMVDDYYADDGTFVKYDNDFRDHKDGIRLNTHYGIRNGEIYNSGYAYNEYHKPQISLNYNWKINKNTQFSTALYASFSSGGGRRVDGENDTWLEFAYPTGEPYSDTKITPEGLLDYNAVITANQASDKGSKAVMSMAVNSHDWYGILSSYNTKISDFNITGGVDFRYYKGYHYTELDDLLGGDYYLDGSNINRDANKPLTIGDKISYYNTGEVLWEGLFGQAEYVSGAWSAFLTASVSNTSYRRIDYFNYFDDDVMQEAYDISTLADNTPYQEAYAAWDQLEQERLQELGQAQLTNDQIKDLYVENKDHFSSVPHLYQKSDWENFLAYSIKGGANYNISESFNVFANAGYFTRAPFFRYVFLNYTNSINDGAKHEKVTSAEIGGSYQTNKAKIDVTLYHTMWLDKALTRSVGNNLTANLTGLNAIHDGLEIEGWYKPTRKFDVKAMASFGNWHWADNINAALFDENQEFVDSLYLYAKDIKVGDAAQTRYSLHVRYEALKDFKVGFTWNHYADLFAQFDIENRTDAALEGVDAWNMPDYSVLDMNVRYYFKFGSFKATLIGNIDNILDTHYISDALDGVNHDIKTSPVYYGFGRTWSVSLKLNF